MMLRILTALCVVQLVLLGTLYWPKAPTAVTRGALITAIGQDAVKRIQLSNDEGATLVLVRDKDEWRLDLGFPADGSKVASLLNALLRNDPGFPIADSVSAAKRFEVSETEFRREVVLSDGVDEAIAYLGTTAALGKIHGRLSNENAVYVLPMSSLDAPVDIDSWLDPRMLSRRALTNFSLYGVEFSIEGDSWIRDDGQSQNPDLSADFADVLGSLQISGLVDAADNDAANADEALRLSITTDRESSQLVVLHNPESDRYYFESTRFEGIFSTSAYDAERLIDAAKALLEDSA